MSDSFMMRRSWPSMRSLGAGPLAEEHSVAGLDVEGL
jgi:hypothetical protein